MPVYLRNTADIGFQETTPDRRFFLPRNTLCAGGKDVPIWPIIAPDTAYNIRNKETDKMEGKLKNSKLKDSIRRIFKNALEEKTLFKNKEILRDSYIPENLPHRDTEVKQLAYILVPILKGETVSNILIRGRNGTGKTVVVKAIGNELIKTAGEKRIKASMVYLDCNINNTAYRVLRKLANQFEARVPFTGWPRERVYNTFKESADRKKQYILVILDKVDKLVYKKNTGYRECNLIYLLTRINSELKNTKVSLIGISNDLRFTDYLDSETQSSFNPEEIAFQPYNSSQLEDILRQRAELAFKEEVLDEFVIPLCVAIEAQNGNAKRAIDLLRNSGEIAVREGADKITENHVRKASEKIDKENIFESVRTLPIQSKAVLYSAVLSQEQGNDPVTTGALYDMYQRLCKRLSLDQLTPRRVSQIISELTILNILDSKVIARGRYGRTKETSINLPFIETKMFLEKDFKDINNLREF